MKYVVKAKKAYLKAPLTTSASAVILRELVDTKDNALTLADFGDWFTLVVKQSDRIEIIKCDGISTDEDGTATVSVMSNGRNIDPTTPYAGATTGLSFQSGAEVIVTNDPLAMAQFGNINLANTWSALQTFAAVPQTTGGDALTANALVRKAQLDAAVLGIATTVNVKVPGTAGETVAAGNLVYFDDTDNEWKKCDADTAATVENTLLGIAQGAGVNGGEIENGVLLRGLDANQSGLTAGALYYASNTAGAISATPGTKEVTIGFSYSTTQLYFNPRFNQQLTEDQQDALEGTSGTPSLTNKYVTNADVAAAATADKIARRNATGDVTVPAIPTADTDATSKEYVDDKTYNGFTASDDLLLSADTERTTSSGTYVEIKRIAVTKTGTVRVKFDLHSTASTDARGRIRVNSVEIGTERSTTSGTYVTYSEDINVSAGDLVQLYAENINTNVTYVRNFRIYGALANVDNGIVRTD